MIPNITFAEALQKLSDGIVGQSIVGVSGAEAPRSSLCFVLADGSTLDIWNDNGVLAWCWKWEYAEGKN